MLYEVITAYLIIRRQPEMSGGGEICIIKKWGVKILKKFRQRVFYVGFEPSAFFGRWHFFPPRILKSIAGSSPGSW